MPSEVMQKRLEATQARIKAASEAKQRLEKAGVKKQARPSTAKAPPEKEPEPTPPPPQITEEWKKVRHSRYGMVWSKQIKEPGQPTRYEYYQIPTTEDVEQHKAERRTEYLQTGIIPGDFREQIDIPESIGAAQASEEYIRISYESSIGLKTAKESETELQSVMQERVSTLPDVAGVPEYTGGYTEPFWYKQFGIFEGEKTWGDIEKPGWDIKIQEGKPVIVTPETSEEQLLKVMRDEYTRMPDDLTRGIRAGSAAIVGGFFSPEFWITLATKGPEKATVVPARWEYEQREKIQKQDIIGFYTGTGLLQSPAYMNIVYPFAAGYGLVKGFQLIGAAGATALKTGSSAVGKALTTYAKVAPYAMMGTYAAGEGVRMGLAYAEDTEKGLIVSSEYAMRLGFAYAGARAAMQPKAAREPFFGKEVLYRTDEMGNIYAVAQRKYLNILGKPFYYGKPVAGIKLDMMGMGPKPTWPYTAPKPTGLAQARSWLPSKVTSDVVVTKWARPYAPDVVSLETGVGWQPQIKHWLIPIPKPGPLAVYTPPPKLIVEPDWWKFIGKDWQPKTGIPVPYKDLKPAVEIKKPTDTELLEAIFGKPKFTGKGLKREIIGVKYKIDVKQTQDTIYNWLEKTKIQIVKRKEILGLGEATGIKKGLDIIDLSKKPIIKLAEEIVEPKKMGKGFISKKIEFMSVKEFGKFKKAFPSSLAVRFETGKTTLKHELLHYLHPELSEMEIVKLSHKKTFPILERGIEHWFKTGILKFPIDTTKDYIITSKWRDKLFIDTAKGWQPKIDLAIVPYVKPGQIIPYEKPLDLLKPPTWYKYISEHWQPRTGIPDPYEKLPIEKPKPSYDKELYEMIFGKPKGKAGLGFKREIIGTDYKITPSTMEWKGKVWYADGKDWQPKTGLSLPGDYTKRFPLSTKVWPKPIPYGAYRWYFVSVDYTPYLTSLYEKYFGVKVTPKPKYIRFKDIVGDTEKQLDEIGGQVQEDGTVQILKEKVVTETEKIQIQKSIQVEEPILTYEQIVSKKPYLESMLQQKPVVDTVSKQLYGFISLFDEKQELGKKSIMGLLSGLGFTESQAEAQASLMKFEQPSLSILEQPSIQIQKQESMQKTFYEYFETFKWPFPQPKITPKRIDIIPKKLYDLFEEPEPPFHPKKFRLPDLEEELKKSFEKPGYDVFVKERYIFEGKKKYPERFIEMSDTPLSWNEAMAFGAYLTDESAARSFKVVPTDEPAEPLQYDIPPWISMQHKFNKKKSGIRVEKTDFAIDTEGELEQITARGIKARMQKAQKLIVSPQKARVSHKKVSSKALSPRRDFEDFDDIWKHQRKVMDQINKEFKKVRVGM